MDFPAISRYFAYITIFTALVPLFFGIYRFNTRPRSLKLLCILIGASFSLDLSVAWIHKNGPANFAKFLEFEIFLTIFYLALNVPRQRIIFIIAGVLYAVFDAVDLSIQFDKVHTYPAIVSCLVFTFLPIVFFYRLIRNLPDARLQDIPMFWFSIAVLLYFSGNLFLFAIYDYMTQNLNAQNMNRLFLYWDFHNLFSVIANFLYAVSFWKDLSKKTVQEQRILSPH